MSGPDLELFDAVRRVVAVLDELGAPYFIGGSVASMIFGEPRLTVDADIIAHLEEGQAAGLVGKLGPGFYADLSSIRTAIRNDGAFNLIHLDTMVKIDVYVAWRGEFAQSQFARRIRRDVGVGEPLELTFATPEDTILAKLDWYRRGGGVSDRQWRDVLGVLKVQADSLDLGYLRDWAGRLGLTDLLLRAFGDAGIAQVD